MTQLSFDFSRTGRMHSARLETSPRLQHLLAFLRQRGERGATTRECLDATGSMAVHSDVAELRANGITVTCRHERTTDSGRRVFRYRVEEVCS